MAGERRWGRPFEGPGWKIGESTLCVLSWGLERVGSDTATCSHELLLVI